MFDAMTDLLFLPPHAATPIAGFHAYSRQMRVRNGQSLELCASGAGTVQTTIVRLGADTSESVVVARLPDFEATGQSIARGSYVYVERGVEVRELENGWTLEIWCRPFLAPARAGLLFQRDCFSLFLEDGAPVVEVAEVRLAGEKLELKAWHHIAASWDENVLSLIVNGTLQGQIAAARVTVDEAAPLLIGALENARRQADDFWTGDLWAPAIYARALPLEELRARRESMSASAAANCVGQWKFDSTQGAAFRDVSAAKRDGRGVNYPQLLVPAPTRLQDSDWSSYDPNLDPDFGHAVRLMADQFLDCRWPVAQSWRVPDELAPGQYAAHLTDQNGEKREVYFLIVPPKPRAKLACLSTTNTRLCYNFAPFDEAQLDYGAYAHHPNFPFLGHLIGAHRPNSGEPWARQTVDWELPFYAWLDRQGIAYDLYSEWDLEENPELLASYSAVAWAGHSEYWSKNQFELLQRFNADGGHLLSFSGNTAYWRVSLDLENAVLEVRKHARQEMPGVNCDALLNAAHHHQMDGLPGAILREAGWPEQDLLGLATAGATDPPLRGPRAGYEVREPSHALFQQPHPIATEFPFAPSAAGYETDISVRRHLELFGALRAPHYPSRLGRAWPALDTDFDAGLVVLARAQIAPAYTMDYDNHYWPGPIESEMVWWQRPDYGTVFCIGSVVCSQILLTNENFSNFVLNVLDALSLNA